MLTIQHNGDGTADVYKGLGIVARLIYQINGKIAVKVLTDGHDEIVNNLQSAMSVIKERI